MYAIHAYITAYIEVVPGVSMGRQSYGTPMGRVWEIMPFVRPRRQGKCTGTGTIRDVSVPAAKKMEGSQGRG